jgi:hypothetical protein
VASEHPGLIFTDTSLAMAELATGETELFSFAYETSPEAVCGSELAARIEADWATGHTEGHAQPERFGVHVSLNHLCVESPGLPIPDGDPDGVTRSCTLTLPGWTITDLQLQVAVRHVHRGDLLVTFTGPNGDIVTLFEGDPADDGHNLLATWDLDEFNGTTADGEYTLWIADLSGGPATDCPRGGTLETVALHIDVEGYLCCLSDEGDLLDVLLGVEPVAIWHDINSDGVVDASDLIGRISSGP